MAEGYVQEVTLRITQQGVEVIDQTTKKLSELEQQTKRTSSATKEHSDQWQDLLMKLSPIAPAAIAAGGAFLAFEVVKKVSAYLVEFVKAGAEVERTMNLLKVALQGAGTSWEKVGATLEANVQRIHSASRFDDEEIRQGLTEMIQLTDDVAASQKAMTVIADAAAARQMAFGDAANSVARGMEGMERALRSLGIFFDAHEKKVFQAATETERLDMILAILQRRYGGAAAKDMETFTGQWLHFKNAVHDVAEEIGQGLLPQLTLALKGMNQWLEQRNAMSMKGYVQPGKEAMPVGGASAQELNAATAAFKNITPDWKPMAELTNKIRDEAKDFGDLTAAVKTHLDELKKLGDTATTTHAKLSPFQEKIVQIARDLVVSEAAARLLGDTMEQKLANQGLWSAVDQLNSQWERMTGVLGSGIGPVIAKFGAEIIKIGNDALITGKALSDWQWYLYSAAKAAEAVGKALPKGQSLTGYLDEYTKLGYFTGTSGRGLFNKFNEDDFQQIIEGDQKVLDDAFREAMREAVNVLEEQRQRMGNLFGSIFADVTSTGGKNLANVFMSYLTSQSGNVGELLGKNIGRGLQAIFQRGGGGITANEGTNGYIDENGKWVSGMPGGYTYNGQFYGNLPEAQAQQLQDQQTYLSAANALISFAAIGMATSRGQMGAGQALLTGATTGASVGATIAGAGAAATGSAVGAGAGLIIAAAIYFATKPMDEIVRFFQPVFEGGVWSVVSGAMGSMKPPTESEKRKYATQLQTQWDAYFNSYASILASLPLDVIEKIGPQIMEAMKGYKPETNVFGDFVEGMLTNPLQPGSAEYQDAAQQFTVAWDEFIRGELPRNVAAAFKPAFSAAFENMGGTLEQFNKYWEYAQTLDPSEAAQYVKSMLAAMASFHDLAKKSETTASWRIGGTFTGGRLIQAGESDFVANLRSGSESIFQIASVVATTFGPTQAAAAEQLGKSLDDVFSNLQDYLSKLTQMSKALSQSIEDARFTAAYQHVGTDKQAQSDFLMKEYKRQLALAGQAVNPEDAQNYYNRALQLATQLYQLDPTKRFEWYNKELDRLDALQKATFQRIGDQARSAVDALLTQVQPFIDFFAGLPVDLSPHIDATIGAFDGATAALLLLKDRIDSGITTPVPGPAGPGGAHGDTNAEYQTYDQYGRPFWVGGRGAAGHPNPDFGFPISPEYPGPHGETTPTGTTSPAYSPSRTTSVSPITAPANAAFTSLSDAVVKALKDAGVLKTKTEEANDEQRFIKAFVDAFRQAGGGDVSVNLNGPVYGLQDLVNVVIQAIRKNPRVLEV